MTLHGRWQSQDNSVHKRCIWSKEKTCPLHGKNLFSVFRLFVWDVFRAEGCLQAFGSTAFVFVIGKPRKIFSTIAMMTQNMSYVADHSGRWGEKHKVWIHLASTYGITMILNRSNAIHGRSLEAFQIRATFREFGWTGFSTGWTEVTSRQFKRVCSSQRVDLSKNDNVESYILQLTCGVKKCWGSLVLWW